jgi:hypothetical protein
MITSLFLAFIFGRVSSSSIMEGVETQTPVTQQQSSAPVEGQESP